MLCTDEESPLMSDCDGVTKVAVEELGDVTSGADDSPTYKLGVNVTSVPTLGGV